MPRAGTAQKCVVNGCYYERPPKNLDNSDPGQRRILFKFPSDFKTRLAWLQACGNPRLVELSQHSLTRSLVCENHFTPEDLLTLRSRYSKYVKKPFVVPTIFDQYDPLSNDLLLKFINKHKLSKSLLLEIPKANFSPPVIIPVKLPSPISLLSALPSSEEIPCEDNISAVKICGDLKADLSAQIVDLNLNNALRTLPAAQACEGSETAECVQSTDLNQQNLLIILPAQVCELSESLETQETLGTCCSTAYLNNLILHVPQESSVHLQSRCVDETNVERKNTLYIMEEERPIKEAETDSIDKASTATKEVKVKAEPLVADDLTVGVRDDASDETYMPCQPFEEVIIKPEAFEPYDIDEENNLDNDLEITEESALKTQPHSDGERTSRTPEFYDEKDWPISSKSPVTEEAERKRRSFEDEDSDDDPDYTADINGSDSNSSNVKGLPNESESKDYLLYCYDCKESWEGDCPKHGPLAVVCDSKVSIDVEDNLYAIKTAPSILRIGNAENPHDAKGVFAVETLPRRMRFGPMEGKFVSKNSMNLYTWVLRNIVTKKPYRCLDLSEPGTSNWMRYLKIARAEEEKNCVVHQYGGKLFLTTIREIHAKEELVAGPYDMNGLLIKYPGLVEISKQDCRGPPPNAEKEGTIIEEEKRLLFCPVCDKHFANKNHLNQHIRTHTGERPFACPMCNRRYSQKGILSKHMRIHSGERPYACIICERRFTQKESLNRHMMTHSATKRFECSTCSKTFTRKANLETHMSAHFVVKPNMCSVCNKIFANPEALKTHLTSAHDIKKSYLCPECNRCFSHPTDLQRHMPTHTEKSFVCTECNQGFSQKTSLHRHFKVHNKGEEPFECTECGKCFTRKTDLDAHFSVHLSETPYQCSVCHKRFSNQDGLNEHMTLHVEKTHVCSVCNRCFPHPIDLQRHMRTHTGEKPFVCSDCNQGFSQKANLQRHLQTHRGEKRFVCPVCNQKYSRKEYLTSHMRCHSNVEPYICTVCRKLFWDEEKFSDHMKSHSSKRKAYKCKLCHERFSEKESLNDHMHTHVEIKSYECSICSEFFSLKQNLMDHLQIHDTKQPFDSYECNDEQSLQDSLDKHMQVFKEDISFDCPVCNGEFPDMEILTTHMRAHATGEVVL